jgi:hypothetical protein
MEVPCLGTCPGLDKAFFLAHKNFPNGGTILEFGVGGGFSYSWMAWWVKNRCTTDRLIGFDSWQGLPAETEGVWYPDCHKQGNYKHDKMWVHEKAMELGVDIANDDRFALVDGFFSETLTEDLRNLFNNVILVNMDVDLHSSAKLVLDWITPLLQKGTVIYTDDYHFPMFNIDPALKCGVSLAFEEWQGIHPNIKLNTIETFPNSQRYFMVEK